MSRITMAIIAIVIIVSGYLILRRIYTTPAPSPHPSPEATEGTAIPTPETTESPTPTPSQSPTPSPAPTPTPTIMPTPLPSALPLNMGLIRFDVSVMGFRFTPDTITVQSGQKVEIDFYNNDTLPHNLVIESLNITTQTINPGQKDIITFIASVRGNYIFFCSIPGHREAGLVGTLKVE